MGLFDRLFKRGGRNFKEFDDAIWLTAAARLRGLVADVQKRLADGERLLVVAHFQNAADDASRTLQSAGFQTIDDVRIRDPRDIGSAIDQAGERVPVMLAETLPDVSADDRLIDADASAAVITILVVERHPLPTPDDRILQFARGIPGRSQLRYFLSLDDPVMSLFAGDFVRNILTQMGMGEDEAIESEMVSRRVRAAQKKIAAESFGTTQTHSAHEWLEQNMPG